MSTTTARLSALESDVAGIKADLAFLVADAKQRLAAVVPADEPAKEVAPASAKPAKAYRSAAGKERAKAQVAALWTKTLADAGVKRAKDLTPAQMDAYKAASKAIWAAVPKTRATKA